MRRYLFFALSALVLAGAAQAAPPKIDVRPAVGAMLSSGWQRVVLHVENPADGERIDGEATLHLRDGRVRAEDLAEPSHWVQPLSLAPGESKDVPFDVRTVNNKFPVVDASVVQGRGRSSATLSSQTFDAFKGQPDGQVKILHITNVSPQADSLSELNGQRLGVRGSITGRVFSPEVGHLPPTQKQNYKSAGSARVLTIAPEAAPESVLPLSTFMAVYVDDMAKLTPAQQEAIQRYVAEGGVLVAPDAKETQRKVGHGTMATLADPRSAWAWARTLRYGIRPEEGQTLLAPRFSLFTDSGYLDPNGSNQGWGAAGMTPTPPPFSTVALFLGVYLIVLVPVQYAVLKRLGKREWAWGVTPALALVFAGAAYGIGQNGRSKIQSHQVGSIVELGNGVGRGAVLTNVGLYSPGLADATVSVEAPQVHVWKSGGGLNAPAEFREDERHVSLRGLRLAQWSVATVSARSEATLGEGIRVAFDGRAYSVENRTGKWLRSVQFQGQPSCGDLAPGAVRKIETFGYESGTTSSDLLMQQMGHTARQNGLNNITALLDEPLVNVRIDGSDAPPQKSATMVVVRF